MKGICVFLLGFLMMTDIKHGESRVKTFPLGYREMDSPEDTSMVQTTEDELLMTTETPEEDYYVTPGPEMWFFGREFGCPGNDPWCYKKCRELNYRGGYCHNFQFTCLCFDCLEEEKKARSKKGKYKCKFRPYALPPPRRIWEY